MWTDPLLLWRCLSLKILQEHFYPRKVCQYCLCLGVACMLNVPLFLWCEYGTKMASRPGQRRLGRCLESSGNAVTCQFKYRYRSYTLETTCHQVSVFYPLSPYFSCHFQTPFCWGIPAPWMSSLTAPPGGRTGRSTKSKETHWGWVERSSEWYRWVPVKLKLYLVGAAERDGRARGQAAGHAAVRTGQGKLL